MLDSESKKKLIEQTRAARLRWKARLDRVSDDAAEQGERDGREGAPKERCKTLAESVPLTFWKRIVKGAGSTAEDIRTVRSRLVDTGLKYSAVVAPLALSLSLSGIFAYGWRHIYLVQIVLAGLIVGGSLLRKRLPYTVRACLLLGVILAFGVVGLPVFGLVGAGHLALIAFVLMTDIAFGTRVGLIARAVCLVIIAVTGAAVCAGAITFSFDIGEYATSLSAWITIGGVLFTLVPIILLALGVVHGHLVTSLQNLRESNAKHGRLVDNLHGSFLYRHDIQGNFVYVSQSVTRVLGYQPEEFLLHFTTYLTDHPVNTEVRRHTALSIQGIRQPPYEVQISSHDGEVHWLEVAEVPVFDENENVVAVEGIPNSRRGRR